MPKVRGEFLSVADGIAYAASEDGTVTGVRVSNGLLLWSRVFAVNAFTLLQLSVIDQETFMSTDIESLAVHVLDGSLLGTMAQHRFISFFCFQPLDKS